MSRIVLTTAEGSEKLPEIKEVKAYGTYVYVEVLSAQEVLRTSLTLTGSTEVHVNEAYILDIGPQVPPAYGLTVGDRIFIDGGITFGPNYGNYTWSKEGRKRGMVLYTSIKGQSVEDK